MPRNFKVGDRVIGRSNECTYWRGIVHEVVVNRGRARIVVEFNEQGILKYFPKRLRPAGTVREPCSDGSKNSDEDSESSEESRSDFEDNGLENISDEKNRDSDDVYKEIDRFG